MTKIHARLSSKNDRFTHKIVLTIKRRVIIDGKLHIS